MRNKNNQGFTIIEVLVVVSVIAMLSSISFYVFNDARIRSRNAKRLSDTSQIAKGLTIFFNQCSTYPALPPAAIGIRIDNSKSLYSGTLGDCNSSDSVSGANGVLPNGGIGTSHAAGANETLFIPTLPVAPTRIDDGNLAVNNRCSDVNTQTGFLWGEYSYYSNAPTNPREYWLYFCIGTAVGELPAGRHIYTEEGIRPFTGNFTP